MAALKKWLVLIIVGLWPYFVLSLAGAEITRAGRSP